MNAYEYRKTLTPRQADAFRNLLETKLRDSGYYARNWETNTKIEEIQRAARAEMKDEFEALTTEYRAKREEIRAKIAELHEQERALDKAHQDADLELWNKAYDSVKEECETIRAERGNARAESELIEQMAIAEYQKRIDKKNKAVA